MKPDNRYNTEIMSQYSRRLITGKVTMTAGIHNMSTQAIALNKVAGNRYELLKAINHERLFKIIWYTIFSILGVVCLCIEPKSWFYVIDLYVLLINADLVSRGKVIGIYIGIVECFLYIVICYMSGLYGEIIKMCLFNIPLNIVAIVSWTKNMRKIKQNKKTYKSGSDEGIVIRKLSKKSYLWIIPCIAVGYVGSYFGLKLLNTNALIFSAGAFVCAITNKILNGQRYKESWFFAILNNLICSGMWIQVLIVGSKSGGVDLVELPTLIGTVAMFINDFYGYAMWKAMYRRVAVNGGEIFAMRKIKINRIIKLRHRYQKLIWNREIDVARNS